MEFGEFVCDAGGDWSPSKKEAFPVETSNDQKLESYVFDFEKENNDGSIN